MQRRAALWITAFRTSPTWGIEAIAGLIPIHYHLSKLAGCHQLRAASLPKDHAINTLLDRHHSKDSKPHRLAISHLTNKQQQKLKSPIVDINHWLNQIYPTFDSLNHELRAHIIDIFSDCFSFNTIKRADDKARAIHRHRLNSVFQEAQNSPASSVIASVKSDVATAYIWKTNTIVSKTCHHAMDVTSGEAELFAIRCGLSPVTHDLSVHQIIIVTDAIHAARRILDTSTLPFQLYTIAISKDLKEFLGRHPNNRVDFWDCPSTDRWPPHVSVDRETKAINI